jgi:hypothetical protein
VIMIAVRCRDFSSFCTRRQIIFIRFSFYSLIAFLNFFINLPTPCIVDLMLLEYLLFLSVILYMILYNSLGPNLSCYPPVSRYLPAYVQPILLSLLEKYSLHAFANPFINYIYALDPVKKLIRHK